MAASLKTSYLFAQHAQISKQLKNVIKILMQALLVILFTFPQFYGYKKVYHKMKIIHHYIFFSTQRPADKLHHKFICLAEHLEKFSNTFLSTDHTTHPHATDNLNICRTPGTAPESRDYQSSQRTFARISQSRRSPLLGPSPG